MTALQLNAELLRELSVIVEDETLLAKALKYIKKLTAKKDDPTLMSKEEFFKRIDDARKGKTYRMKPEESLDEFFRNLDEAERDIADGKGIEMLPNETLDDLLKRVG